MTSLLAPRRGRRSARLRTPQNRAHALQQQTLGKWLFDVVVGPHAEAQGLVHFVVLRRQEDDRQIARLPQPPQHLVPVHARHLDVEDGKRRRRRLQRGQARSRRPCRSSPDSLPASSAIESEDRMFRSSSTSAMVVMGSPWPTVCESVRSNISMAPSAAMRVRWPRRNQAKPQAKQDQRNQHARGLSPRLTLQRRFPPEKRGHRRSARPRPRTRSHA